MKQIFAAVFASIFALFWVGAASAQSSDAVDDRGYLQAFLEDALSDTGREIRIIGFEGALSARATVAQITIADDDGIWLTLNKVGLGWNRAALLRGALDISELSAEEIILARRPVPANGLPAAEASGFSLPELPISIDIAAISAPRIVLGQEVLGQRATLRLTGDAHLSGGAGRAALTLERSDGRRGVFALRGSFDKTTTESQIAIDLSEEAGGLAATLLNLPDRPALALSVNGAGPLDDFTADLSLETNGKKRLTGQVVLTGTAPETTLETTPETAAARQFRARLSGDVAPLFLPEFRAFFGDDITLTAEGARGADGALRLDDFSLTTQALTLGGSAALDPDGWPARFALSGELAGADGAPVLLPLPGPRSHVARADLDLRYDRQKGDDWAAQLHITGLSRPDVTIAETRLSAAGQLRRGDATALGALTGVMTLTAEAIGAQDAALARAIGPDLQTEMRFDWQQGAPLRLSDLRLAGADYRLSGALDLHDIQTGLSLDMGRGLSLELSDLSRFSDLANRDLTGAARLDLRGTANLLGGAFDLALTGTTSDLTLDQPQIDPLLAGPGQITLRVMRDATGTRIIPLLLRTDQARLTLSADLKSADSSGRFAVEIPDSTRLAPGLTGATALRGTLRQDGKFWHITAEGRGPGAAQISARAQTSVTDGMPGRTEGRITAEIGALAPYRALIDTLSGGAVGKGLSGALSLSADGSGDLTTGAFDATLSGRAQDLALGQAFVDPLLRGESVLSARVSRAPEVEGDPGLTPPPLVKALDLATPQLSITAAGAQRDSGQEYDFKANIVDLASLAAGVNGPATVEGTARRMGDGWRVDLRGEGPEQAQINIAGQVAADGARGDLGITGAVHLGLLNPFIQPRLATGQAALDLRLRGPLALSSLGGNITVSAGKLVLPTYQIALDLERAGVALSGGRAQVDVRAGVQSGGQVTLTGPVALTAPFDADLAARADAVHLSDGAVYDTIFDGTARLAGPLAGGARIKADVVLGATEIRVPEAGPTAVPIMAGLTHLNEPTAVRATRKAAGLISDGPPPAPARAYPLDLTLSAPSQIFVRGRGLDAELGGSLILGGTSADVIPQGQFDLIRGRLDILGKRLDLTEGRVQLQGGFDPLLSFVAESKTDVADVTITVDGPASDPTVTFAASPDRPQDEVLALLLFGRDITEISPLQALRMAAAVRTLAGKGGEGIVSKLRGSFALDDLDVSTDADGGANLRVGKYLSENIYSDVTIGSDGEAEVQLNLNISPSLTARGGVKSDGESTLGIFYERDY